MYCCSACVALEVAVGRRSARVHDPLGNALVVEVGDLLAEDEVLEQRRPTQPRFERVLVVGDRHALIGRQRLIGRVDADAIQRADGRVVSDVRATAPCFLGAVRLAHGARPDDRIGRLDGRALQEESAPRRDRIPPRLIELNGNSMARSCVPAAFRAQASLVLDVFSGTAGPLTVAWFFRTLVALAAGGRRVDFAISKDPWA